MIIKNIQSTNFLKYENLSLANLPAQGLITISGQNESGKTSIGETLCFALFGRTFTLDLSDPRKLIRWGASQCSVSLTFTARETDSKNNNVSNDETYTVERYLDNEGTYGSKLSRDSDGATLAKGPDKVSSRILELINFGYNEFVESFYLAQRELTTPHPHSQTIKVMAGIAPLSNIRKKIASTSDDDHAQLEHLQSDFNDIDNSYTELSLDPDWMPELQTALTATDQDIESRKQLNEKLLSGSQSYNNALPVIQKKKRSKSWTTFFSMIFFLLTLTSWTLWFFHTQEPQSDIAKNVTSWIQDQFSNGLQYQQWLLPIAIISSVLLLLTLILSAKNARTLRSAQHEAATFSHALEAVQNHSDYKYTDQIFNYLSQQREPDDFPANDENTFDLQQNNLQLNNLLTRSQSFQVTKDENTQVTTEIVEAQELKMEDASNLKQMLEHAINEEQERLNTGVEYTEIMNGLESRTQELSHLLDVNEIAVELLESAGHHLSHKFNQTILKLAGDALPSFTQGRYKHLKIDDTMDVRVFSSEKGDFLDLDEVSSGTQRQIMLSLRLAMSQALINAIECSPQFIFLDEPFAFFDQERIRDTMAALPSFSDDINQIWLVAQEFPEGINTDLRIECRRDKPDLVFDS